jgi:hypothetical protein
VKAVRYLLKQTMAGNAARLVMIYFDKLKSERGRWFIVVHEILYTVPEKKQKQFNFRVPNIEGKIGFSLCLGKKEFFIGIAIATIEMETITRKKKVKVLPRKPIKTTFIPV